MAEVVVTAATVSFATGAGLAAGATAQMLLRMAGAYSIRAKPLARARAYGMSDSLQKWAIRASKDYRGGLFSAGKAPQLILMSLLAATGFWAGLVYLKNLPAAVLLACVCVALPGQARAARLRAYREKVIEQLGAAVRVFAAEYSDTPHPVKALSSASNKLPDPIGAILRRAARDLSSARNFDEIDMILLRLGKQLGSEYGRLFVQLLRLSFEDEAVKPLFARLAARVTSQQDLIRKNRLGVSMDRMLAVVLNLAAIPAYFFVSRIVPEAGEFFTATSAGKGLVALCLLSVAVGSFLDIILGGGEQVE